MSLILAISDAAMKAIEIGKLLVFKDNWKDFFEWHNVMQQIKAITWQKSSTLPWQMNRTNEAPDKHS